MKVTIRIISVVLGFAAVATNPCFAQDLDDVEIKVHPVSGNVSYLEGSGGNIGLFVGEDGVFLIDDQYALLTERIVAAIRTVSNEPIRFLINTHMHPDHVGGNENFGKMGTLIFGHDNVRSQMAIAGYEQEPPLVTFSKDMSLRDQMLCIPVMFTERRRILTSILQMAAVFSARSGPMTF